VLASLAAVVPSVPLDFEITGSSLGSVSLFWTAPLNDGGDPLVGFYIYYRLSGTSSTWSKTELISEENNAFTVSALEGNK
jgi:hypothetical protein